MCLLLLVAVDPMSTKPMGYPPVTLRLVKFVWYPSDPFKVHEQKVILLSSFTVSNLYVLYAKLSCIKLRMIRYNYKY